MKEIITLQHAESHQHLNGMVGGWTDWELTERGKKQADYIGQNLASRLCPGAEYIMYSSDLARARQTAEIAGAHTGHAPILDRRLREIYFGQATGKSMEWLNEHALPKTAGQSTLEYRNLPDAESLLDVHERISSFIDELIASPHERFIVASHSAALGMFFTKWLRIDTAQNPCSMFAGEAAGVSRLLMTDAGDFMMCYLNDMSDWAGKV